MEKVTMIAILVFGVVMLHTGHPPVALSCELDRDCDSPCFCYQHQCVPPYSKSDHACVSKDKSKATSQLKTATGSNTPIPQTPALQQQTQINRQLIDKEINEQKFRLKDDSDDIGRKAAHIHQLIYGENLRGGWRARLQEGCKDYQNGVRHPVLYSNATKDYLAKTLTDEINENISRHINPLMWRLTNTIGKRCRTSKEGKGLIQFYRQAFIPDADLQGYCDYLKLEHKRLLDLHSSYNCDSIRKLTEQRNACLSTTGESENEFEIPTGSPCPL